MSFVQVCAGPCPKTVEPPKYPEKILFCGWRRDIDDMIMVTLLILSHKHDLFWKKKCKATVLVNKNSIVISNLHGE